MKRVPIVCGLLFVLLCAQSARSAAKYAVYYLDSIHNVYRQDLDVGGHPTGAARKLTTGGGYWGYSVSPDEKHIVAFELVSSGKDDLGNVWNEIRCFVDTIGGREPRRVLWTSSVLQEPDVVWSSRGGYFSLMDGAFEVSFSLYRVSPLKKVVDNLSWAPSFSDDDRFVLTWKCSSDAWLTDLVSGKRTRTPTESAYVTWVPRTRSVAWVGDDSCIWVGRFENTASGPQIIGLRRLSSDRVDGMIRCVEGRGLYFVSKTGQGCFSADLKKVTRGPELPDEPRSDAAKKLLKGCRGTIGEDATYSVDCRFLACPVGVAGSRTPEIRVFDQSGKSWVVGRGSKPWWRGRKGFGL